MGEQGPVDLYALFSRGAILRGLVGDGPVEIRSVDRLTDDSAAIVYRNEDGSLGERIVFAHDVARVRPVQEGAAFAFDGDPAGFLLAAEARRMRLSFLFDPQSALGTSDVDPLPHQLRAVYEEMLPRQPLRYVLADDPGAGKTIMCGLLVKELIQRGDAANVLIVAPGSLTDQWQDEMSEKFHLEFNTLTKEQIDRGGNPFERGGLWLARLDVLARNSSSVLDHAMQVEWDLIVFDEAHKLSATVFGGEVKKTKRYQMAERLGASRNLLLMTATPHSGKEEQFQLFLALLDADRFEGAAREGTRRVDVSDLMRRMVKEELLRFDGTRLFPERKSYTVQYPLSDPENDLYLAVTDYVRLQWNLADRISETDKRRGTAVGFALTTLQRRLASSPAAIHKSLERRLNRLQEELSEARLNARRTPADLAYLGPTDEDDLDDLTDSEREEIEDQAISTATAAASVEELETEIRILTGLVDQAAAIRYAPSYSKWDRLRETLDDNDLMRDHAGNRRKVIIFTEHKDTLDDLTTRLRNYLGRDDAVITIHGGTRREDRRKAQETFRNDPDCVFLVATDAAGEGVNLQNAHLLINFDLPWNPNRIEQRFGRVHRIGQREICHMWSLVAKDTREGLVYTRLLEKLEQQRAALGGRVYDVLGTVFDGNSLRDLMIDAIRQGDTEEARARLFEIVDAHVGEGLQEVLADDALVPSAMSTDQISTVRDEMDRAEAARLQPHHVEAFFQAAFTDLGGNLRPREHHRYEIRSVPGVIKDMDRIGGSGITPVVSQYARIAFDKADVRVDGFPADAALIHPGHPLMAATLSVIAEKYGDTLRHGAIVVDRNDPSIQPFVVCLLEHDVVDGRTDRNGQPLVVSRRAQYARLDQDGSITALGQTPIPNYEPASQSQVEAAATLITEGGAWVAGDLQRSVAEYGNATLAAQHYNEIAQSVHARVEKTLRLVRERLNRAITFWDTRAAQIAENERAGKSSRLPADQARERAEELARRLDRRTKELALEDAVAPGVARVTGACLVLTQGWLDSLTDPEGAALRASETARVDRLAVDAVLAKERALGHHPKEMPHNNPGYDIESHTPAGLDFIEVKGRIDSGDTFTLTRQEAVTALNKGERSVLALVRVHSDDTTTVRYLRNPVTEPIPARATSVNFDWDAFWNDAAEHQW